MFSVFLRVNVFGVSFQHELQTCCKQSCVEIEICVLFTYIRTLLHKACLYKFVNCILHLIDNTINIVMGTDVFLLTKPAGSNSIQRACSQPIEG